MRFKMIVAAAASMLLSGLGQAQAPAAPAPATPALKVVPVVPPAATPEDIWHLDLSTGGRVTIQLRPDAAPAHVERIRTLTRRGFYDGLTFHRVIEGFMAQGGDPAGDGTGGSDLPDLPAEFNILPHTRGTVSAARAQDPNSANSQFFIMLAPRLSLDGDYTPFGRVTSGMQYVDAIAVGEPPAQPTRILQASLAADNKAPPPPAPAVPAAPATPVLELPATPQP